MQSTGTVVTIIIAIFIDSGDDVAPPDDRLCFAKRSVVKFSIRSRCMNVCIGTMSRFVMNSIPSNHEFQWNTPTKIEIVATIGIESGTIILKNIVSAPAPSKLADSSRLGGMVWK